MAHRVLVVGSGSIGERHLRCFAATGRAEVGLCEIDNDLRAQVAERYALREVFASLDAALAKSWDAAVIATPAPSHIPIARRLIEAGAHVLIEKPLSTSLEGIPALLDAVLRAKRVAAVAYVWRSHPVLAAMREAINSGRFGRALQVLAFCGQFFPLYRPAYREIYYADRSRGGGAIQDAMTHMLNAGEWLAGPIERVAADAAHQVLDGVDVEDTVNVMTRQGGVLGCYALNQHQAPNEISMTVICQRGTARFEVHENRWRWMSEPGGAWNDQTFPPMQRDEWFIRQANQFLDAIEAKAAPVCSLEEGVQTLKVNLAVLASADSGSAFTNV